ncbi:hypothetical protein DENSPDRAFT_744331, partial [Dentipellis sp. KUC8613]
GHTEEEPGAGDLAQFCSLCPQPTINMPDDWQQHPERYIRFTILDGNFKLVHMYMRRPENDVPLNDGLAFLRSTCHSHRAVNQRNAKRKNLRATGIGAAACMHGCFVPHAVVDFHAGEQ